MLETPHVAVGVLLATKIPNPWISIPLSLSSHFILDKIPHWNPHLYTETQKFGKPKTDSTAIAIVDIASSLVFGLTFAYRALPNTRLAILIIACSFASVLSDVIKYPYYYFNLRNKYLVRWVKFERSIQVNTSQFWGIVTQVSIIAASLYTLLS